MKKIFIMSHTLELGGAERSLIGLLHGIDYENYKVDLFLMHHEGALFKHIPSKVNLLPFEKKYSMLATPFTDVLKSGQLKIAFGRLKAKLKAKRFCKKNNVKTTGDIELEYSHKYTSKYMPKINEAEEYDLAISFLTPHYFVKQKVKAKKTLAFIHTDYSYITVDRQSEEKMWNAYDYLASVSPKTTENFLKTFPSLKDKIIEVGNALPKALIDADADAFSVEEMPKIKGVTNILSVGRFCEPKNFDNVPFITKKVLESGKNIKWYLIGFGPDEELIRANIAKAGMQDNVIILGKKENPYPYIKACDIYAQPSRYEGKAVTVLEAQTLAKPVFIANYKSSKSQLKDGIDGVIFPLENDKMAEEIVKFIDDKELQSMLIENCKNSDYSNKQEVNKIYEIIK